MNVSLYFYGKCDRCARGARLVRTGIGALCLRCETRALDAAEVDALVWRAVLACETHLCVDAERRGCRQQADPWRSGWRSHA
jgi:hypothetical protein